MPMNRIPAFDVWNFSEASSQVNQPAPPFSRKRASLEWIRDLPPIKAGFVPASTNEIFVWRLRRRSEERIDKQGSLCMTGL
jgi:hypothetical protein